jgi:hypothetical protein
MGCERAWRIVLMRSNLDMGGFPSTGTPLILRPNMVDDAPYNRVDYLTASAANTIIFLPQAAYAALGIPIKVWKNGSLLYYGIDYSLSGSTITLNVAAAAADTYVIDWWSTAPQYRRPVFQFLSSIYADIAAASPVGFWKLGETTSTYADSGSGAHALTAGSGITRGAPSIIPLQADLAASIPAAQRIGNVTAQILPINNTQNFTVVVALNCTSLASARYIFEQGLANTNGSQGTILLVETTGAVTLQVRNSGVWTFTTSATGLVVAGQPMLLAVKLDAAGAATASFYKNGSRVGSPISHVVGTGNQGSTAFSIGASGDASPLSPFSGTLQGFAIWTSLISDANLLTWAQDAGFA